MSVDWMLTAACRTGDAVADVARMFDHDGLGHPLKRAALFAARAVCASCPHTGDGGPCIAAWRELDGCEQGHGMWGGRTGRELVTGVSAPGPGMPALTGLPGRIVDVLQRHPATVKQLAETLDATPKGVTNALVSLRERRMIRTPDVSAGGAGNSKTWHLVDPERCASCGEWSIGEHCRTTPRKKHNRKESAL